MFANQIVLAQMENKNS